MSRPVPQDITCPQCGETSTFTTWSSLNVTLDPGEKPNVLDRSIFRFTCGKCGHSATVVYPMLYHDMQQKVMLWLLPETPQAPEGAAPPSEGLPPEAGQFMRRDGYRFRSVGTQNALIEKILIFDAGLDDGPIEMLKPGLWNQLPADAKHDDTGIFFSSVSDETPVRLEFAVVKRDGVSGASVEKEPSYGELAKKWDDLQGLLDDQPWPRVDQKQIIDLIEQRKLQPGKTSDSAPPAPRKPWWKLW